MNRDKEYDRRRWIEPEADNALNDATWERIGQRLDAPPRRSVAWPLAVGVAFAAAAVAWLVVRPSNVEWNDGDLVAMHESVVVFTEDGTAVEASPHSRVIRQVREGHEVHLEVAEGEATFDVETSRGQTFTVHAGEVDVVVAESPRVRIERGDVVVVAVERGAVEIRHAGATVVVSAGEIVARARRTRETQVETQVETENEPQSNAQESDAEQTPRTEPSPETGPEDEVSARPASRRSAGRLFESARNARREGQHQDAARTYEEFLRRYPSHNNATLAAFELGRLKMDILHDPRGAAGAFARAAIPGSPFRQDAMARHAQALAASGDRAGCARATARYEATFPEGRHLPMLADACN